MEQGCRAIGTIKGEETEVQVEERPVKVVLELVSESAGLVEVSHGEGRFLAITSEPAEEPFPAKLGLRRGLSIVEVYRGAVEGDGLVGGAEVEENQAAVMHRAEEEVWRLVRVEEMLGLDEEIVSVPQATGLRREPASLDEDAGQGSLARQLLCELLCLVEVEEGRAKPPAIGGQRRSEGVVAEGGVRIRTSIEKGTSAYEGVFSFGETPEDSMEVGDREMGSGECLAAHLEIRVVEQ